jgi:hypothetical protein
MVLTCADGQDSCTCATSNADLDDAVMNETTRGEASVPASSSCILIIGDVDNKARFPTQGIPFGYPLNSFRVRIDKDWREVHTCHRV